MTAPSPRIRLAGPDDAERLLGLQLALDRESAFMMLERGERDADVRPLRERLAASASGDERSFVLGAFASDGTGDAAAVGYVDVSVPPFARARTTGGLVVGVRASCAGQGVGGRLLAATLAEARSRGLRRLELTVMTHNHRALNLYMRHGFQVEGLRRDALLVGGAPVSEYYMGLVLGPPGDR